MSTVTDNVPVPDPPATGVGRRRWDIGIALALFLLALLPRSLALDLFSTCDEGIWLDSSVRFLDALGRGDWQGTLGKYGNPGVTTEWLGAVGTLAHYLPHLSVDTAGIRVAGRPLMEVYRPSFEVLAAARYPLLLLGSLLVTLVYLLLRRKFDRATAGLAALLVAFDPFFVGMSRTLDDDSAAAIFALLVVLCLWLAVEEGGWWWWVASGSASGLAFLAKSPDIVLVPVSFALCIALYLLRPRPPGGRRALLTGLALWSGACVAAVFVFWPSMWVQPWTSLQSVVAHAVELGTSRDWVTQATPLFYPLALVFRATPLVLVGCAATWVSLGKWLVKGPKGTIDYEKSLLLFLWAAVAAYVVMFSAAIHKNDFYIVRASVALDVIGAIGLMSILGALEARGPFVKGQPALKSLGVGLVVVVQVALCLAYYPYYFGYYNPLLGGPPVAARLIPAAVGHGEGLDQVGRYLNSKDEADNLLVGMSPIGFLSGVEQAEFKGKISALPPFRKEGNRHWAQWDYLVFYRDTPSYGPLWEARALLEAEQPELVVSEGGVEYARVYRMPQEKLSSVPAEAKRVDAVYDNGLSLAGYKLLPVERDKQTGLVTARATLYWQAEHYCDKDYRAVLKLRNAAYTIWGTRSIEASCKGWEPSWNNALILPDEQTAPVLPATPPGSYTLELAVVHTPDGREMQPGDEWSGVLGSVEIPRSTNPEAISLDMEHPLGASLSDQVRLLGYSVAGGTQRGEKLQLTLFWQALTAIDQRYKVFVHVVDRSGRVLAQRDGEPVDSFYPTDVWQANEIVRDQYEIPFADDAGREAAGLRIGMYLASTGERVPVKLANGTMPEDRAIAVP